MTTCAQCQSEFTKQRMGQKVCSPICARRLVSARKAQEKERAKLDRMMDKNRAEAQKDLRELLAEAQKAFNEFIRLRDADQPCISCGAINPPMKPGGQWDAGHFLSRGAYPELRFDEDNVHKQCKSCNAGSGKFSHKERTVSESYRANLPERIGQERFDILTGHHELIKWERDVVRQIRTIYRARVRDMKKGCA